MFPTPKRRQFPFIERFVEELFQLKTSYRSSFIGGRDSNILCCGPWNQIFNEFSDSFRDYEMDQVQCASICFDWRSANSQMATQCLWLLRSDFFFWRHPHRLATALESVIYHVSNTIYNIIFVFFDSLFNRVCNIPFTNRIKTFINNENASIPNRQTESQPKILCFTIANE